MSGEAPQEPKIEVSEAAIPEGLLALEAAPPVSASPEPLAEAAPVPAGAAVPTFADLWAVAYQPPRDYTRLMVAAALLVGLGIAARLVVWFCGDVKPPSFTMNSLDTFDEAPSKQQEWLADAIASQTEPMPWDPVAGAQQQRISDSHAALPQAPAPQPRPRRARVVAAPVPAPAPLPAAKPSIYEQMWGPPERYAAASSMPSTRANHLGGANDGKGSVKGMLLYARLKDQLASDAAGAEVIATLSHKALVGDQLLPGGTEVHGNVSGAAGADTRIFVTFAFARLADGQTFALTGAARDEQGRAGIPAKKLFNRQSAGSIGIASATRALQAAGREIAGPAGAIVGSGIEGAADSGTDKARRADNDEYVLIAKPGTAFQIYVQSAGSANGS